MEMFEHKLVNELVFQPLHLMLQGKQFNYGGELTEFLKQRYGAYLHFFKKDQLRGEAGAVFGTQPLFKQISEIAMQAAFSDNRFPPMTKHELPSISFKLTIFKEIQEVGSNIGLIQPFQDTILLTHHGESGLIFPFEASEHKWDIEKCLMKASNKLNLGDNAWRLGEVKKYRIDSEVIAHHGENNYL